MFTGIIEELARVLRIEHSGTNATFWLQANLASQLKVDQSLAHNGVCLTVEEVDAPANQYRVTAIQETLEHTDLGQWAEGKTVNLERCLQAGARLDGHIVQGHVDATATCTRVQNMQGSWEYDFEHGPGPGFVTVPKGSICVNGVSLTVVRSSATGFSVAIIPYTYEHTTFGSLREGDTVNLEFDILGKYIATLLCRQGLLSNQ